MTEPAAFTAEQAATYMGLSRSAIYLLVKRGQIGTFRPAGLKAVRITRAACDEFIAANEVKPVRRGAA